MRPYTKKEVIDSAERWDTTREVNYYEKQTGFEIGRVVIGAINAIIYIATLLLIIFATNGFVDYSRFLASDYRGLAVSYVSIGMTAYALAFSFSEDSYYGIDLLDYILLFRRRFFPARIAAWASVIFLFVLELASIVSDDGWLLLTLFSLVCAFTTDLLPSLLMLFGGKRRLHGDVRTYVIEKAIANTFNNVQYTRKYIVDLFEDAGRSNLHSNIAALEDDMYAIRCIFGVFSLRFADLKDDELDLLRTLHKHTAQLVILLARKGDYRRALIILRRCSSRPLANQFSNTNLSLDNTSIRNLNLFDFSDCFLQLISLLSNENIYDLGLCDLIRDYLYVYGMTSDAVRDIVLPEGDLGSFTPELFSSQCVAVRDLISYSKALSKAEVKRCNRRIFCLRQNEVRESYMRSDGQHRNMYYRDLNEFALKK